MRNAHRRRPRRHTRELLGLTVALLLALATIGPASAATRSFTDRADVAGIDIRAVQVKYGNWLEVRVGHDGRVRQGQSYRFWFDTARRNPGPEYYYSFHPNSDTATLGRIDGFDDRTQEKVTCGRRWGGAADQFAPRRDVIAFVAGRCLGNASKVRVSMRFVEANGAGDWAPRYRKFYDWVPRR